ncbi:MAG: hypothetical protein Q7S43_05000 [bacterium]|nr:hypothetical protein [bacterium]
MFIIVITSIFAISGSVLAIRKIWPSFKVCPICAGVLGTWLWLLLLRYLNYQVDLVILGLLMGGSVVGIAYQLADKIRPGKIMAWKILFISAGFSLAYNLVYLSWTYLILSAAVILILLSIFIVWPISSGVYSKSNDQNVEGLEEKMKNCC